VSEQLKKDGYSEGTVGVVQTFYFRDADAPWTADRLAALAPFDVLINLTRLEAQDCIYPCVDPLTSRSRWLERAADGDAQVAIAQRVRTALAALRQVGDLPADQAAATVTLERARKLRRFFGQPFFCAEPYTRRPGLYVSRAVALDGCRAILDGEHDDLPVAAFDFDGSMQEIRARAEAGPAPEATPA
jgi:F-type H+-transporting ATPase subunit beta